MKRQNKFKINPNFKSFEDARIFARSLDLKSRLDWDDYVKGKRPDLPERPVDIPYLPNVFYRYQGWSGYPDFLEYPTNQKFRQFKNARIFARSLNFCRVQEWQQYCRNEIKNRGVKPKDIPSAPHYVYKNRGWISYNDWLGNAMVEHGGKLYEPFEDAKIFARSLKLKSIEEWAQFHENKSFLNLSDCPEGIPRFPYIVYEHHGWKSWEDFLGTNTAKRTRKYRDFAKARDFARSLRLKNNQQWREYCRGKLINRQVKPNDIPQDPSQVYKEHGWISWSDFMGTDNIATKARKYRPFEQARDFVRKLKLKDGNQWWEYCKSGDKPDDIPSNLRYSYRGKWQGMADWLGTDNVHYSRIRYLSYIEARDFVRKLGIKSGREWRLYVKGKIPDLPPKPLNIPSDIDSYYKGRGWISWGDFLGTGSIAPGARKYRAFGKARAFVHRLKLKNFTEWQAYCKSGNKPEDIPANPNRIYDDTGWLSYGDWLNNGNISFRKICYLSYEEAQEFVRKLGIKTCIEWELYVKGKMPNLPPKPLNIPSNINTHYKGKGWVSWKRFMGTEKR